MRTGRLVVTMSFLLALLGCYTVLKHPEVRPEGEAGAGRECWRCHEDYRLERTYYYPRLYDYWDRLPYYSRGYYERWWYYNEYPWWWDRYYYYDSNTVTRTQQEERKPQEQKVEKKRPSGRREGFYDMEPKVGREPQLQAPRVRSKPVLRETPNQTKSSGDSSKSSGSSHRKRPSRRKGMR
ncbi:MAG TPA: hypothetical protein EYP61_07260 [Candidatus Latescibacteria bacterium]|nr:hypothetical protein [Candidatus Latescibacterota bacterium]